MFGSEQFLLIITIIIAALLMLMFIFLEPIGRRFLFHDVISIEQLLDSEVISIDGTTITALSSKTIAHKIALYCSQIDFMDRELSRAATEAKNVLVFLIGLFLFVWYLFKMVSGTEIMAAVSFFEIVTYFVGGSEIITGFVLYFRLSTIRSLITDTLSKFRNEPRYSTVLRS